MKYQFLKIKSKNTYRQTHLTFPGKSLLLQRFALGIVSLFCLSIAASAQYPFESPLTFNTTNGLSSDAVTAVEFDGFGFAWIGTGKGLNRLDGNLIEQFLHHPGDSSTLANNYILDLKYNPSDTMLWIGHMLGVSTYDPIRRVIKNYYNDLEDPHSVPNNRCFSISIDGSGRVWLGFLSGGLVRYNKDTDDFDRFLCNERVVIGKNKTNCKNSVRDLTIDPIEKHILWLGVNNNQIVKFDTRSQSFDSYTYNDPPLLDGVPNPGNISKIFAHPNGKIYFTTWYSGIFAFDTKSQTFSPVKNCLTSSASPFAHFVGYNIASKATNELWVSGNKGILVLNTDTDCITQELSDQKEKTYNVSKIDQSGRIWSASLRFGLQVYNPLHQQLEYHYFGTEGDGYGGGLQDILEDPSGDFLYVGAIEAPGLFLFDLHTKSWKTIPPPSDYDIKNKGGFRLWDMLLINDKELLITEDDNFFLYRSGSKQLERFPIQPTESDARLRKMVMDESGKIWINSERTVRLLDLEKQTLYDFDSELEELWEEKLGGRQLSRDAAGNIWLKDTYGLLIYDIKQQQFFLHLHDDEKKNGLMGIGHIEPASDGSVWVATRREFLGFGRADSARYGMLKVFSQKEGLIGDHVYYVKAYKNKLIVFTERGIQFFDPATQKFGDFFDLRYGMENAIHTATILQDGRIAFGARKGIGFFHPDSLKKNKEKVQPYITSFKVFDKNWQLANIPQSNNRINLSYRQNFFSFDFSAIGFSLPQKITYRYMLKGFDPEWKDGTQRKFAAYTNVPGGDYQFIVEAINNEGIASGNPSVTHIHISTVWWKTTWFWMLASILILGIGYLLYRLRIAQVRKEERLKSDYERRLADVEMSALRAQMNPHFIFNSLNSIEYYIISNDPEKASDYLNRFSRLIRLTLQNSKTTIVRLKDDLEGLQLYIELESLRFDNLFDYEVQVQQGMDLEKTMIPPLLIQPYVENAIWHGLMQKKGEKGMLSISISKRKNNLICYVEDNGIGREAADRLKSKSAMKRKSYGMKITSDRLDALNHLAGTKASVQIFDLKNDQGEAAGTRVELVIPL